MQHVQPTETGTGTNDDSPARSDPERSAAGQSTLESMRSAPARNTRHTGLLKPRLHPRLETARARHTPSAVERTPRRQVQVVP
jgi:hypothetical protein